MNLRAHFAIARQTEGNFLQALRDARPEPAPHIPYTGTRLDGQLPDAPAAASNTLRHESAM